MIKIRQFFESIFENLGLVMAPITAAVMTGLSIQHFFVDLIGGYAAGAIGFVFAFAIEATGYMSFVAYQKDKDAKKPFGYLASVVVVVTIIELFVFGDFQRWGIGLSGVAIAGIMYWSYSSSNAESNTLEAKIKQRQKLEAAGMTMDKNGNVSPKRSKTSPVRESRSQSKPSPTKVQKMRKSDLLPEEKQAVIDLTYIQFCNDFRPLPKSTFQLWKKEFKGEKSLNGAG